MIGMILRSDFELGQKAANCGAAFTLGLPVHCPCRSVGSEMDIPGRGDKICVPNPTPSPSGRMDLVPGPPPIFFALPAVDMLQKDLLRQEFAQIIPLPFSPLAAPVAFAKVAPRGRQKQRGKNTCGQQSGSLQSPHRPLWRAVATVSVNGRFMAPAPACLAPPSLTAMSQPARLPVQRPTSPIAKLTRPAADPAMTSASGPEQVWNPIAASGCGGVFVVIRPGAAARDQEPEGTRNVQ